MKLSYNRECATLIQARALCLQVIVKAEMDHIAGAGNVVAR